MILLLAYLLNCSGYRGVRKLLLTLTTYTKSGMQPTMLVPESGLLQTALIVRLVGGSGHPDAKYCCS
jgi:hypothetical protein